MRRHSITSRIPFDPLFLGPEILVSLLLEPPLKPAKFFIRNSRSEFWCPRRLGGCLVYNAPSSPTVCQAKRGGGPE
jgi:hypothetical protein